MKKKLIIVVAVTACVSITGCTARFDREVKSFSSNWNGGLNRTVTVYDYNGGEIKSWSGKFDVSESENEVYFDDSDGKRVIIHGGIVVNEEN